jgi:hypothetical protein
MTNYRDPQIQWLTTKTNFSHEKGHELGIPMYTSEFGKQRSTNCYQQMEKYLEKYHPQQIRNVDVWGSSAPNMVLQISGTPVA